MTSSRTSAIFEVQDQTWESHCQEEKASKLLLEAGILTVQKKSITGAEDKQIGMHCEALGSPSEFRMPTYLELAKIVADIGIQLKKSTEENQTLGINVLNQKEKMHLMQKKIDEAESVQHNLQYEAENKLEYLTNMIKATLEYTGHTGDCDVVELASSGRVMKPMEESKTCTCGYIVKRDEIKTLLKDKSAKEKNPICENGHTKDCKCDECIPF